MKAPTPVITKAVAKLLAQVQAEAQAATLEALSAKDGIVVLQPMGDRRHISSCGPSGFIVNDTAGTELRFFMWRRQEGDRNQAPVRWTTSMTLLDGQGREWSRSTGHSLFMDDFGTLVSVEGVAA